MQTSTRSAVSIVLGGDAGQGVESSGAGFARALARAGFQVATRADYRSRIRGGHNFYQVRAGIQPVHSHSRGIHLLLALTPETVAVHQNEIVPGGAVIFDEGWQVDPSRLASLGVRPVSLPLSQLAETAGGKVMANTVVLGAAAAMMALPLDPLMSVVEENFARKGRPVVDGNLAALRAGYEAVQRKGAAAEFPYTLDLPPAAAGPGNGRRPSPPLLHGNHAFALGALAGGCRFVAAYPMTPATSLFEYLTAHAEETGLVSKHAEDEIAAITMAAGAGFAGARALVATSGGGFSLMVEALGMAGMVEVPLVVFVSQRGGPSTGLPTRSEQGDLLFTLFASQGEFPRVVLAPATVEQAFEAGWRSFNLAEKYQCPVIVLSDEYLSSSLRTVPVEALNRQRVKIDRGATLTWEDMDRIYGAPDSVSAQARPAAPYRRFAFTENGISPRAVPGHPAGVYAISTDEHDEWGHISEDQENRTRMMEKRMRKLETALACGDMRGPELYGPAQADLTLITWGSTYGAAREAVDLLNGHSAPGPGHPEAGVANLLTFTDIWPFPVEPASQALAAVRRGVVVEQNYTGQLARFLRMMAGYQPQASIRKYDGRPLAPEDILEALRERGMLHEG